MKKTPESRGFTLPNLSRTFDNWDWDEFASTVFGIVFGTIFVGLFLVVIAMVVYLAWTSGFGGFVIAFVALVGVAAIIAAIVQIVGRRW